MIWDYYYFKFSFQFSLCPFSLPVMIYVMCVWYDDELYSLTANNCSALFLIKIVLCTRSCWGPFLAKIQLNNTQHIKLVDLLQHEIQKLKMNANKSQTLCTWTLQASLCTRICSTAGTKVHQYAHAQYFPNSWHCTTWRFRLDLHALIQMWLISHVFVVVFFFRNNLV